MTEPSAHEHPPDRGPPTLRGRITHALAAEAGADVEQTPKLRIVIMAMRVVAIVLVLGLGGFVWYTSNRANTPAGVNTADQSDRFNLAAQGVEGVEPEAPPVFNVDVELRREGNQRNLYFTVSEQHGWAADHLYVEFWYEEQDEDGEWYQVGDPVRYLCHDYLGFSQVLREHTTLLDVEFRELDDFGTSENWRARIAEYGTVLAPK